MEREEGARAGEYHPTKSEYKLMHLKPKNDLIWSSINASSTARRFPLLIIRIVLKKLNYIESFLLTVLIPKYLLI